MIIHGTGRNKKARGNDIIVDGNRGEGCASNSVEKSVFLQTTVKRRPVSCNFVYCSIRVKLIDYVSVSSLYNLRA